MNPKKHRASRRVRPEGGSATHRQEWIEVERLSRAGVKYTKYKSKMVVK